MSAMFALGAEDRRLITAQVERFASAGFDLERCRAETVRCTADDWRRAAESGLLALGISPAYGGIGGGAGDWGMVLRELGRNLSPLPYLEAVVIASRLVDLTADPAERAEILSAICDGKLRLAFAHSEPQAGNVRDYVLAKVGDDRLHGTKTNVVGALDCTGYLVTCRGEDESLQLYLIDPAAEGLTVRAHMLPDKRIAATLDFAGVPGQFLGRLSQGVLDEVLDLAAACIAAESVGACEALNRLSLDYAKTRQQFGQPIGKFQVIQHRLVDMYIAQRKAAAVVDQALAGLDANTADSWALCSAAKAHADRAGTAVGEAAIQIHGGMGMTDECAVGHFLKRILSNAARLGTAEWHVERFCRN